MPGEFLKYKQDPYFPFLKEEFPEPYQGELGVHGVIGAMRESGILPVGYFTCRQVSDSLQERLDFVGALNQGSNILPLLSRLPRVNVREIEREGEKVIRISGSSSTLRIGISVFSTEDDAEMYFRRMKHLVDTHVEPLYNGCFKVES